uniref:AlNc14C141G7247 protein n=1 Tax=Albugo laibachii Nc14 TaxID=890382 RepID=F0WL59_9STRA|nr:AlNc14C141G7247 [Albugo laibachii Nc14]|eukprot:CCA22020.1 AlNc14C141G7247 [Albugo laibachii Nc14]
MFPYLTVSSKRHLTHIDLQVAVIRCTYTRPIFVYDDLPRCYHSSKCIDIGLRTPVLLNYRAVGTFIVVIQNERRFVCGHADIRRRVHMSVKEIKIMKELIAADKIGIYILQLYHQFNYRSFQRRFMYFALQFIVIGTAGY